MRYSHWSPDLKKLFFFRRSIGKINGIAVYIRLFICFLQPLRPNLFWLSTLYFGIIFTKRRCPYALPQISIKIVLYGVLSRIKTLVTDQNIEGKNKLTAGLLLCVSTQYLFHLEVCCFLIIFFLLCVSLKFLFHCHKHPAMKCNVVPTLVSGISVSYIYFHNI